MKKDVRNYMQVWLLLSLFIITSCHFESTRQENEMEIVQERESSTMVNVEVNNQNFTAEFYDSSTTQQFLNTLPVTILMSDMNRNEKYYNMEEPLPLDNPEQPKVIHAGEIMCWNGDTLVLFYETFSNSFYGYVKLGQIENIDAFSSILRNDESVEVTFNIIE